MTEQHTEGPEHAPTEPGEPTERTSITGMTGDDMVASLTGFEEIAIEKFFDNLNVARDSEDKPNRALRALVFVWHRRQEVSDREAFQTAQSLPFKDLLDYFDSVVQDDDLDDDLDEGTGKGRPQS